LFSKRLMLRSFNETENTLLEILKYVNKYHILMGYQVSFKIEQPRFKSSIICFFEIFLKIELCFGILFTQCLYNFQSAIF
jgi:hypothetical protein